MNIVERIADLRSQLREKEIDAYIITGTDPHLSEYIPDKWKTREWISGFTGSYGRVLVTADKAFLWTDTRYFLQAEEELKGTGIELMKERVPEAISVEEWLTSNLKSGSRVAVDGSTLSAAESAHLSAVLSAKGILFDNGVDLVTKLWLDRPVDACGAIFEHPLLFSGMSRGEKIERVRNALTANNLQAIVVATLDDIAWLFNLRGGDVQYTPVFTAYAYVDQYRVRLFVHPDAISGELKRILKEEAVAVTDYVAFYEFLGRITNQRIHIDPVRTNSLVYSCLKERNLLEESVSPITRMKATKSPDEITHIKTAHRKDGAAMVEALYWLEQTYDKEKVTEVSFGQKLNEFRSRQLYFKGDSFHPVVGFGPHGAIVHYHATAQSDTVIVPNELLLIDSGGQYLDGTTDLTRTVSLGRVTQQQKEDFTFCLKSHIALATAVFPEGLKGHSLDAIARKALWDRGINYGHGTGHGIGYFLSVHEGPMSIRTESNNEPIREGHLLSNEPGIYREGKYGIRIENVIVCKKSATTEFGSFLCFETISLCPIDRKLIDIELLNISELNWINHYHKTVFQEISPLIDNPAILEWLKEQCELLESVK